MPVSLDSNPIVFNEGSTFKCGLITRTSDYSAPNSTLVVFNWANISVDNPAWVAPDSTEVIFDFSSNVGPQSIGFVEFNCGDELIWLDNSSYLPSLVSYEGTALLSSLYAIHVAYMACVLGDGASCVSDLATTTVLTGDGPAVAYQGDENDFDLTIYPSGPISDSDIIFSEGSENDTGLLTQLNLSVEFDEGVECDSSLDTCPGCNSIVAIFEYGDENDVTNLITFAHVSDTLCEGTELDLIFTTNPFWAPTFVFQEGSSQVAALSTTSVLTGDGPLIFNEGPELDSDFTTNPPWKPTLVFCSGDEVDSSLATTIRFPVWFYFGDEVDCDLETNPAPSLSLIFSEGVEFDVPTIAAQQSLPVLISYHGSCLEFLLSNLENWYVYSGDCLDTVLSTQVNLTADGDIEFDEGCYLDTELTIHPSEPLADEIVISEGSYNQCVMLGHPHVTFSVIFEMGIIPQVDFSTTTHSIDLSRQCDFDRPDSYFYWKETDLNWLNLTDGGLQSEPGAVASGMTTTMNVTIAFREKFYPLPMCDGNTLGVVNFWPLLEVPGTIGFGMSVIDLKFDPHINLCFGNFIPDGASVDAELAALMSYDCDSDKMYEGTSMVVGELQLNQREEIDLQAGDTMFVDLDTFKWMFVFFYGDYLQAPSQVNFEIEFAQGEVMYVDFKPLSVVFSDGIVFNATMPGNVYYVEFLEVGCLDNEYTPETVIDNQFGAPLVVNIEMRPFFHQIQAECF